MNKKNENTKKMRYNTDEQQIDIKYLMNISMNFKQIIDTIYKLFQLQFLTQQMILRRYIAIQCKIVFNRQIIYLFAKISEKKKTNILLNKQYLALFAGDPKLVEPLLTNSQKNNYNDIFNHDMDKKQLNPSQITRNREIFCAFVAVNFYSMSKIHGTIQDLLALQSIQIIRSYPNR